MHGYGMGFGGLFWIVIIIALIWIGAKVFSTERDREHSDENSAFDILKERYAKGEIGKDEFEEKKKDLIK